MDGRRAGVGLARAALAAGAAVGAAEPHGGDGGGRWRWWPVWSGWGPWRASRRRPTARCERPTKATKQALAETRKAQADDEAALAQSEESRKQAEAVSTFLVEAFRSPDPAQAGRDVKVADVLDRAGEKLDQGFAGSQATKGALLDALGRDVPWPGPVRPGREPAHQGPRRA